MLMEEQHHNNGSLILEAEVGAHDVIYLTVSGKITNERFYAFVAWTEKVKKLVREMSEKHPGNVLILSDVSGVSHFESKPIVPLRELLNYNKQYPAKSAVVGARDLTRVLLDTVISLTSRVNIKQFKTKEEALVWLMEKPLTEPVVGVSPLPVI